MKIILAKDIPSLGPKGTIVEVKDGYGRNYLLPGGFAIQATPGNVKKLEEATKVARRGAEKGKLQAQRMGKKLEGLEIVMERDMGEEGKLFGAVTSQDIAEAISRKPGIEIDHRKVDLEEPIRVIGSREVILKLLPEVKVPVRVEVVKVEVKKETTKRGKKETKKEVKKETKKEVKKETKKEVKKEVKKETKKETEAEVKEETKKKVKKGTKNKSDKEIENKVNKKVEKEEAPS